MTNKGKIVTISILTVIAAFLGIYGLVLAYRNKTMSAFDYIKTKGAVKSTTVGVGDRYDFNDFGFYSNNRAVQFSTGKKGTYNKVQITFDDGTKILLSDIFK